MQNFKQYYNCKWFFNLWYFCELWMSNEVFLCFLFVPVTEQTFYSHLMLLHFSLNNVINWCEHEITLQIFWLEKNIYWLPMINHMWLIFCIKLVKWNFAAYPLPPILAGYVGPHSASRQHQHSRKSPRQIHPL